MRLLLPVPYPNVATESSTGFARQRRKYLYALDTRHQIRTEATLIDACVPACLNHARQPGAPPFVF